MGHHQKRFEKYHDQQTGICYHIDGSFGIDDCSTHYFYYDGPFCPIRFSQFTSTIRDDPTDRCGSGCQTEFDQAIDE